MASVKTLWIFLLVITDIFLYFREGKKIKYSSIQVGTVCNISVLFHSFVWQQFYIDSFLYFIFLYVSILGNYIVSPTEGVTHESPVINHRQDQR